MTEERDERVGMENDWVVAAFVGQVKAILHKRGIAVKDLGELMGRQSAFGQQTLSKPSYPRFRTMCDIADALGQRIHMFIYDRKEETIPTTASPIEEILLGSVELTEENHLQVLAEAMTKIDGVQKIDQDGKTLTVSLEDQEAYPQALSSVFSLSAFVEMQAGKAVRIKIQDSQ